MLFAAPSGSSPTIAYPIESIRDIPISKEAQETAMAEVTTNNGNDCGSENM